jgi:hypothetical protein
MRNNWIVFPKPTLERVHNQRQFKSFDDMRKSEKARVDNARNSTIPAPAKLVYLKGIARLCNAEKVLSRGNNMTGYKVSAKS